MAFAAAWSAGVAHLVGAVRVGERLAQGQHGGGEVAHRVGDLGRHVLPEARGPHDAAREHADVADREVDLRRGLGVEVDRAARAAAGRRVAGGLAADGDRVLQLGLQSVELARPQRARARRPPASRASMASATSRSVAASSSSTGSAARRTIFTGSAGSSSALTSSAIPPPISASMKRAPEKRWLAGWSVATSTPETAAWVAKIWPLPRKTAALIASSTTTASGTAPGPISRTRRVGDPDPDRDAERELDRAAAALADGDPERDDRRDRREERLAVPGHLGGDQVGGGRGDRRLHDRAPGDPQAIEAGAHRGARQVGRALDQRPAPLGESGGSLGHDAMVSRSGGGRCSSLWT